MWVLPAAVNEKRGSVAARVFVDTNVLFPFSVMDVMLALTEDSVHEIVWSERLLAEWESRSSSGREGVRRSRLPQLPKLFDASSPTVRSRRRPMNTLWMKCRATTPTIGTMRRQRWPHGRTR